VIAILATNKDFAGARAEIINRYFIKGNAGFAVISSILAAVLDSKENIERPNEDGSKADAEEVAKRLREKLVDLAAKKDPMVKAVADAVVFGLLVGTNYAQVAREIANSDDGGQEMLKQAVIDGLGDDFPELKDMKFKTPDDDHTKGGWK